MIKLKFPFIAISMFVFLTAVATVTADCTNPECAEIRRWGNYTNLVLGPPTQSITQVWNGLFGTQSQAISLYSSNAAILGGNPVAHATKTIRLSYNNVGVYNRDCPAQTADGVYYVTANAINGDPPVAVPWQFCANAMGQGVEGSWNQGKTKDQ